MMDQSYFTIRWKRLLVSLLVFVCFYATWLGVLQHQQGKLTDRLLTTARQLADGDDSASARVAYLDYLELHPDDSAARVELIQHIQKTEPNGNDRDTFVVSQATSAIRSGDSSPELRLILIDAAMRLKWFSTVSQWLPSVSQMTDQNPRLIAYSGVCLMKKGESEEAEALFKTALLSDSSCPAAWSGLIELTKRRGEAESAIDVADDWVAATSSPIAFLTQARLLVNQGRPDEAAAVYQTAVLPAAENIELVRELAQFFVHEMPLKTEVDSGVLRRIYDITASALKEASYDDLVCLADLAHRLGDMELAQRHYQQCLENQPGDDFATGRQVELFSSMGLDEQASQALDNLTDSSSQKVLKTTLQARLMAQESRFEEATVALESVIKLHSHPGVKQDCFALLVECLWEQQRFSEAAVRAEELLELAPASDNARTFCAEGLIRSSQYSKAIKCIRGFTSSPKKQIDSVWRLMAHADDTRQQDQLTKAVDNAALINREATVPVLYAAFRSADAGQTSDSVRLLLRTMVEYPRRSVFRMAIQASKDRALERILSSELTNAFELKDSTDQTVFLQALLKTDSEQVAAQIKQQLLRSSNDASVVTLLQKVLSSCGDQQATRRQILLHVYPALAKVVSAKSNDVIPKIAKILIVSDLEKQAFELLATSMRSDDELSYVSTFCHLMRTAKADSLFHPTAVADSLKSGSLSLPDAVKEILLVECEIQNEMPEAAADRIKLLVSTGSASDAVQLMLMIHADQLKSVSFATLNPDAGLRAKYPDSAAVLLAGSRWNRSQGLYSVSATLARDSFLIDQCPATLVEMAYSEWLANSTHRASELIALSLDLQLEVTELQPLHQKMLLQMRADSRMEVRGLSREDGARRISLH